MESTPVSFICLYKFDRLIAEWCGNFGNVVSIAGGRVWLKVCHFWRLGAGVTKGETDDSCRFWQSWF